VGLHGFHYVILGAIEREFPLLTPAQKLGWLRFREDQELECDGLLTDPDVAGLLDPVDMEEITKAGSQPAAALWTTSCDTYRINNVSLKVKKPRLSSAAASKQSSLVPTSTEAHELQKYCPPNWRIYKSVLDNRFRVQESSSKKMFGRCWTLHGEWKAAWLVLNLAWGDHIKHSDSYSCPYDWLNQEVAICKSSSSSS